jgi:hypothetical protein
VSLVLKPRFSPLLELKTLVWCLIVFSFLEKGFAMRCWMFGFLVALVQMASLSAQEGQTESAPPAVELEKIFREDARASKDARDATAALTDLSIAMRRIDLEQKAGNLEEQEALGLSQAILRMSKRYGEFDEATLKGYSSSQRSGQLVQILKFSGAGLIAVAVLVLIYLTIGPGSLEAVAYLVGLGLIVSASDAMPFGRVASALTGGIVLSLPLGFRLRESRETLWAALTIIWAFLAVCHDSSFMGAIAVAALMGLFGFVVLPITGGYAMGWHANKALKSGTMAAFVVLSLGCVAALGAQTMGPEQLKLVAPFDYSARMLGTTVGLLGLLILSCFDSKSSAAQFSGLFVLAAASCVGLGTGLGLSGINGPAGVLGFFWVLAKVAAIDLGTWGWFWKLLGGSGLAYIAQRFIAQHPEVFSF